ncbi:lasso peptide biosynthesis B2 protein [Phototrophicus methaneseepsis]|uniref:Lasso peptide biosynthesis B2 protein n=1 Tax=Phototrophicus methaneseepsis TaxID=2710758 RepID=A0A7S8EDK3_9CHLR|nr:lasso peptide biosynthesis B2 protein [Phototrophicus methaneseepsis]QPC85010.1 lasso peptide biosynthesis B2 protein [Phototrophicus methaneseepsis]
MSKLRTFRALSPAEKFLLIEAALNQLLVVILIKCLPFRTAWRYLVKEEPPSASAQTTIPMQDIDSIAMVVELTSRKIPTSKCLARSLTMHQMLARRGLVIPIKIGVTHSETGALEAHAWVEYQGEVVLGYLENLADYKIFPADAVAATMVKA